MPRWLSTATKAFIRSAPTAPAVFEVRCLCGWVITGVRQTRHQRFECEKCGEQLFVLPANVYPQPAPKKKYRKKSGRDADATSETEKTTTPPPLPATHSKQPAIKVARPSAIKLKRPKRIFSPFRMAVLVIVVFLSLTGYWMWRSSSLEQAELTLREAGERGFIAMRSGDFVTAAREFQMACGALDILARNDQQSRAIRQMLKESTAVNGLIARSLFEVLTEFSQLEGSNAKLTDEKFSEELQDRWIIMESNVLRTSDVSGRSIFQVDYPLMVGGSPVVFEAELPIFERIVIGSESQTVIFAAQIENYRLEKLPFDRLVLTLNSQSAFLWSDLENLQTLGFYSDELHAEEQVSKRLRAQSQLMGIEP